MKSFRSSVFDLCTQLREFKDEFTPIRDVVYNLEHRETNESSQYLDLKQHIFQNGKHISAQFYGIILAFEKKLSAFEITDSESIKLSDKEYECLSRGNQWICMFLEACLSDIDKRYPLVSKIMNPYSFLQPIQPYEGQKLQSSIFDKSVEAFKNTKVYRQLIDGNLLDIFARASEEQLQIVFRNMHEKIIGKALYTVPKDIVALKLREQSYKANMKIDNVDGIMLVSFKMLALREMLANAAMMICDAILDRDLLVVDSNNLINIKENTSNTVYTYKTVLLQGMYPGPTSDMIRHLMLFRLKNNLSDIKEFGSILGVTEMYDHSAGETMTITFCVLDEDLNPIYGLTDVPKRK